MSRKRVSTKSKSTVDMYELSQALIDNGHAMAEGPKKKHWTKHDLKNIKPITETQSKAFDYWFSNPVTEHIAMLGTAGTGKSFLGIFMAMSEILRTGSPYFSLKIVRSIVQTRQIGAIPGTLDEKKMPIFDVYQCIFESLFGKVSTLRDMVDVGLVELIDTSYIRGSTWDNSIVLIDEVNNMNDHEIHTVMTRVGESTRVIVAGDKKQSDIAINNNKADKNDFDLFVNILNKMSSFGIIQFNRDDIVRSKYVKEWICAQEDVVYTPNQFNRFTVYNK